MCVGRHMHKSRCSKELRPIYFSGQVAGALSDRSDRTIKLDTP